MTIVIAKLKVKNKTFEISVDFEEAMKVRTGAGDILRALNSNGIFYNAGANLGVMSAAEAIRKAREQELDVVEINPKTDPPVVKIMDYGQFRYQKEKEMRLQKAHQHIVDIKGIRMSLRIGKHDFDIRKNQALKFLNEGDKVRIELSLRGRENQQAALGFEVVRNFVKEVNEQVAIRWEQDVEKQGPKITTIIAKA
jgi:translation initiation factor IF-3